MYVVVLSMAHHAFPNIAVLVCGTAQYSSTCAVVWAPFHLHNAAEREDAPNKRQWHMPRVGGSYLTERLKVRGS